MMKYIDEEKKFLDTMGNLETLLLVSFTFMIIVNIIFLPPLFGIESFLIDFMSEETFAKLSKILLFTNFVLLGILLGVVYFFLSKNMRDRFQNMCISYRNNVATSSIRLALDEIKAYRNDTKNVNEDMTKLVELVVNLCNQAFKFREDISTIIALQPKVENLRVEYAREFEEVRGILDQILSIKDQLTDAGVEKFIEFLKLLQEKERDKFKSIIDQLEGITQEKINIVAKQIVEAIGILKSKEEHLKRASGLIDGATGKATTLNNTLIKAKQELDFFLELRREK